MFMFFCLLIFKPVPQRGSHFPPFLPFPSPSDSFLFFFSFFISCLCFSSSTFIDQAVQCNLMSPHRELSCIPRLKPADGKNKKEMEPERLVNKTIAWSFSSGTRNRHFPLSSLYSAKSDSLSVFSCSLSSRNCMLHFPLHLSQFYISSLSLYGNPQVVLKPHFSW